MLGVATLLAHTLKSDRDPVTFSFAFFGCNRVDKDDWKKHKNPSSANLPQLHQNFKDVASISPRPQLLFVTGDLVLGYGDDEGQEVKGQLDAWMDEYKKSAVYGKLKMIPLAGNHEVNRKVGDKKLENKFTTSIWNEWIKRNDLPPHSPNGPTAGGADKLSDDQSVLNFSFDYGKLHFTCLNTDTRVEDGRIGYVPAEWATRDIQIAAARKQTIFVLGHRNVVDGVSAAGDAPIEAESGKALISAMKSTPNVLGYLCAHVHAWDVSKVNGSLPWQIIAGNGGSKLEKDWNPTGGKTFGFALIEVHKSGKVVLIPYARKAKDKYDDEGVKPAQPQAPVVLGSLAK